MKIHKILIYGLAAIGFSQLLFMIFAHFGPIPLCDVNPIGLAISPSKQHTAKLTVETCNDKIVPEIQLGISDSASPKTLHSAALGVATTTDLALSWLSGNRLQITYPPSFKITQQPSELGGIEITFVPRPINTTEFNKYEPTPAPHFTH